MAGEIEFRTVDPLLGAVECVGPQYLRTPRYRPNTFCQKPFQPLKVGGGAVDDRDRADRQAGLPIGVCIAETGISCRIQLCHYPSPPVVAPYQYPLQAPLAVGLKTLRTCLEVEELF